MLLLLLLSSCPTVDDAEIAGSHALRQIPVKNSFRRWSVGIISKVKRIFLGIEILLKTSQKSTQAAEFGLESYIWKLFWWIMRPGQLWSQEKAKWEKEMCSSYFWWMDHFFHTICCVLQANAHWLYSLRCDSRSCRSTVWSDWARFCPLSLCVSADKDCSAR